METSFCNSGCALRHPVHILTGCLFLLYCKGKPASATGRQEETQGTFRPRRPYVCWFRFAFKARDWMSRTRFFSSGGMSFVRMSINRSLSSGEKLRFMVAAFWLTERNAAIFCSLGAPESSSAREQRADILAGSTPFSLGSSFQELLIKSPFFYICPKVCIISWIVSNRDCCSGGRMDKSCSMEMGPRPGFRPFLPDNSLVMMSISSCSLWLA